MIISIPEKTDVVLVLLGRIQLYLSEGRNWVTVRTPWMSVDLVTSRILKRGLNSNPSKANGHDRKDRWVSVDTKVFGRRPAIDNPPRGALPFEANGFISATQTQNLPFERRPDATEANDGMMLLKKFFYAPAKDIIYGKTGVEGTPHSTSLARTRSPFLFLPPYDASSSFIPRRKKGRKRRSDRRGEKRFSFPRHNNLNNRVTSAFTNLERVYSSKSTFEQVWSNFRVSLL